MAQRAGRIACPRCGANNFDTVSACWKCSTPLGAGAAAMPPMPAAAPPAAAPSFPVMPAPQPAVVSSAERFAYQAAPAMMAGAGLMVGNPTAANRAAMWLGLLFPYFGLPIGLAFMMCDDRRRQEVGRICLLWSLLSGAVHCLLMFVSLLGMRPYFEMAVNTLKSQALRASGGGGGSGLGE